MAVASTAHSRRNDILPRLELSYLVLADLRPSPRKVRTLDPAHLREVASSISVLGFCDPVLVGRDNELIDGEARLDQGLGSSNPATETDLLRGCEQ